VRVAVLGAGLQGSCTALELARHGVEVDLVDRAGAVMTGASSHNEGKVHLGYIYANDPTRRTARTMIEGALEFGPGLRRWLGAGLDDVVTSSPFVYVVHRESMLGVEEVETHLADCVRTARELLGGREPDYFGADPRVAPRRLPDAELAGRFDPATVVAAYATEEVAVDPTSLARAVRPALEAEPLVRLVLDTEVRAVTRLDSGVVVHTDRWDETYDHVVNALWSGRLAVDRTAGVVAERPWLWRVKYFVRLAPTCALPSTTIMLGPFGDVVTYADGGAFLSWYPAGRLGTSADLTPPAWPVELDAVPAKQALEGIVDGLAEVIPEVGRVPGAELADGRVLGGVIYAHGHTDIDDPASVLHERHDIGPATYGHYHSVDTGKLTMAPRFARLTAERVLGRRP
jgi:glycine/D-amino acid oxidase-like deaminating enzyme